MFSRHRLISFLLVLAVLVILATILAGGGYWLASQRQALPPGWHNPVAALQPTAIDPILALETLAGASDRQVLDLGLPAGRDEAVLSLLLFAADLSDQERAGAAAVLANRYAAAGNRDKATLCYQIIADLALLSPALHDYLRASLLLQTAAGLRAINQPGMALTNLDLAQGIVRNSPNLQTAHRTALLAGLAEEYNRLGQSQKAGTPIPPGPAPTPVTPPAAAYKPLPIPQPVFESDPAWAGVQEAQNRRLSAARGIMLALRSGITRPAEPLTRTLQAALLAEDQVRLEFYKNQASKATSPGLRAAVAQAQVNWLLLKYRVALGLFGLSLVPEWEQKRLEIRDSLATGYDDLFTLQQDLATALPDPLEAAQARVDVIRDELTRRRLGIDPSPWDSPSLLTALQQANRNRIGQKRDTALYLSPAQQGNQTIFVLVPTEQYERARP